MGCKCLPICFESFLGSPNHSRFLWVTFLLDEICAGSCDEDIRQSLRDLPKDLKETFTRALSRIFSRAKLVGLVQKLFRWVAAAKRPLTLDELREAVSIDTGQRHSRPERLVHDMSRIVLWCENLLQITEEEPMLVQFAHSSIRDFMTKANLPLQLAGFHVDLEEADHFAGEICVTYLHFNDFTTTVARRQQPLQVHPMALAGAVLSGEREMARVSTLLSNSASRHRETMANLDLGKILPSFNRIYAGKSKEKLWQSHPFLQYAAKQWIFHTTAFREGKSITWGLWNHMITGSSSIAHMPWRESPFQQIDQAILVWSHQTHHYALLGHTLRTLRLCESKRNNLIRTSASEGDIEAIKIFLGIAKCSTKSISNALQAASEGGHLDVVERLLSAKADVNAAAAGSVGRTALQAASEGGHLDVVERLLSAKADVNAAAASSVGRTALQAASEGGHLDVVERLLSAKADVNAAAASSVGRTALQAASEGGHLDVVERLLSAEADVNAAAADYGGRTALQAASEGGHLDVVERLLSAKADVNAAAAGSVGRTALQAASEGGHLDVVERLLSAKADVNAAAASSGGRTALQAASKGGHLDVVERLLSAKADVNAAAADIWQGRTALQAASEGGHLDVVERLLSAKADVNAAAASSGGRTALQAASEGGHLDVVERLLSAKADINAAAADIWQGRTALQAASEGGHLDVVERLLSAKADVNAATTDWEGRTALQAASEGGHLDVVERLLSAKADVNAAAADCGGRTALQAASEGGHLDVVERLLSAKADVDAAAYGSRERLGGRDGPKFF